MMHLAPRRSAAQSVWPVLAAIVLLGAAPVAAQTLAFTGATVWDGSGAPAIPDATILVRGGRILHVGPEAPPADATVVDLSGRWVIPGLVNAHGHVTGLWAADDVRGAAARMERGELLLFARYGVTTVNSLGGEPPEAAAVRAGNDRPDLGRARLHFAGPIIVATNPAEAGRQVEANAAADVDWIKIRVDDNLGTTDKMPWPAVQTVMDEAHARGFRVATHLFYLADAKRLLHMGSGMIAHSVRDRDVDADFIDLLIQSGVCYVPTLVREVSTFVYGERPTFFDDPFFQRWADARQVARVSEPTFMKTMAASTAAARYRIALAQAQRNLTTLQAAGVPIAMGTDSGPDGRFPGYFEHMELRLMQEAGLTPEQILRSATGVAADCLGLDDVGMLRPGRWADFLVLGANPLDDVKATESLTDVYIAGNRVR